MYNSNDLTGGLLNNYVRINTSHQNNMNIPAGDRNRNFFFFEANALSIHVKPSRPVLLNVPTLLVRQHFLVSC